MRSYALTREYRAAIYARGVFQSLASHSRGARESLASVSKVASARHCTCVRLVALRCVCSIIGVGIKYRPDQTQTRPDQTSAYRTPLTVTLAMTRIRSHLFDHDAYPYARSLTIIAYYTSTPMELFPPLLWGSLKNPTLIGKKCGKHKQKCWTCATS